MANRARRDQRGAIALEFLLVIGMLIVVFLVMLQYAVRAHAERVATAAAEEGLAAAANYDATAGEGEVAANAMLSRIGPGLEHTHVIVTRTGTIATVTVTGQVAQLAPLLPVAVTVHVEGPVERFVPTGHGAAP